MYVIIYLIIYTRAVSVSSVVWWWSPRWCGVGVLGGVSVSSVVWWWCPRRCGGGVLGGVMVESSVVWCRCPRWCGVGVLCGVMVESSVVWWWSPRWHISSRAPRRAHHEAPQCGGGLACESKLQGEIDGYDCSNYQLFRCPSWDSFYRLVCNLKY